MGLIVVGFVIAIIIMAQNISSLKEENKRLYGQLKKVIESRNELLKISGLDLNQIKQQANANTNSEAEKTVHSQQPQQKQVNYQEKPKRSKEETKNNLILMTGAFLVVLAAIVFLMSMWDTISDMLKVTVLILLMGVFLGASKIAEKTFKLKNTSNTFFYIAMAYIPVLALAIYLIRLSSGALQSSHDQNVFWLIACLIMSLIYGAISLQSKRKPLITGSMLTQVLAVIFGTCIFTDSFTDVLLGIVLYNFALTIVDVFVKPKLFHSTINVFNKVLSISLLGITNLVILIELLFGVTISTIIATLLLSIIALIYGRKTDKTACVVIFVVGIFMSVLLAVNFNEIYELHYRMKQIIMLVTTVILFIFGMFAKWDKLKSVTKITTYVFLGLLYVSSWSGAAIHAYIVPCVTALISILMMKLDSNRKNGYLHVAASSFVIAGLSVLGEFSEYGYITYVNLVVSVILFALSLFVNEKSAKILRIYTNIAAALSIITLSFDITLIKFIINVATSIFFCINTKKSDLSEYFNLAPLILLIPNIYFSDLVIIQNYNIMQVISIVMIISTTLLSMKDKRINAYTFMPYVYLFMQATCFDINKYINIILLTIVSMLQMSSYKDTAKSIAKIVVYLSLLILYNTIIADIKIEMLTVSLLGYILVLAAITRNVIAKNNIATYKTFEYIGYTILFLIALFGCSGDVDAMLFMTVLLAMIIFTYMKKFGPIFLCSVIAEILMAFKVTKEFWASIPWWVYLLVVGGVLISFAVRNEVKEKEEGKTLKDSMKKISDKLDM